VVFFDADHLSPDHGPGTIPPDNKLNPMYPFIELYHQILLQGSVSWAMFGCVIGLAALVFVGGILFFERSRHAFADVL